MGNFNIVFFVCADKSKEDSNIKYDQLIDLSVDERRSLYWKCALVSSCVSKRTNPDQNHIIFTNDERKVIIDGIDIRKKLEETGVQIRHLSFDKYYPQNLNNNFKNSFYRFEVLDELGNEKYPSVVMDTDCLWVKSNKDLEKLICEDNFLLYDIYKRSDTPELKGPHNLSMKDMGKTFKEIDPNYPNNYPVWYGGEFISGTPMAFKKFAKDLYNVFSKLISEYSNNESYKFPNGRDILYGDESLSSFVLNKKIVNIKHVNDYLKRIWTYPDVNNVSENDIDLTIWHLIAEKKTGLHLLYKKAINPDSEFWKIEVSEFRFYLGKYCGIPKREFGKFNRYLIKRYLIGKLKKLLKR